MCLVYPMVPVSLDCLCSVFLRHVSCLPNGSSFSRLSLFCLSSSCVLCTQWCQFLLIVFVLFFFVLCLVYPISVEWWYTRWNNHNCRRNRSYLFAYDAFCFVFLRHVSCVPNGASFSRMCLFFFVVVMCLVYPMVPVSLDCICSVCLRLVSCVPNGASLSRMSLFCFSSSCVLCTQWCQFL